MSTARGIRNPEKLWFVLGAAVLLLCLGAFVWWALGVHQRAADRLAEIEPRHARLAGLLQDNEQIALADQALQTNLALYLHPSEADAVQIGNSVLQRAHFVGEVRSYENGMAEVETKNRFQVGDTLEIIHPLGNRQVKLETMFNLDGAPVQVAQGSPVRVRIPLEGPVEGALIARLL